MQDELLVGVLALQGDVAEHEAVLRSLGAAVLQVRRPEDLSRVDALVLPGGESTTLSMLLDWSGLIEPLQQRLNDGMPAFGTCAGLILLARQILDGRKDQHCFGAIDLSARRNAFGPQVDSFEADLQVSGLVGALHAVFIRAPSIESIGPGVETLAEVQGIDSQKRAVLCREGRVLVAAFHPEISGDSRVHQLFLDSVREYRHDH